MVPRGDGVKSAAGISGGLERVDGGIEQFVWGRAVLVVFFCCLLGLKILLGVCGGISTVFQAVLELFGYPMSALRGGATGSGPSGA